MTLKAQVRCKIIGENYCVKFMSFIVNLLRILAIKMCQNRYCSIVLAKI